MGNIYESALCDLLWLGEDFGLSPAVATLLKTKFDTLDELKQWKYSFTSGETVALGKLVEDPMSFVIVLEELWQILGHPPVWKRIWIVQEVNLAQDVQVIYGAHKFHWTTLALIQELQASAILRELSTGPKNGLHVLGLLTTSSILLLRRTPPRTKSLVHLLSCFVNLAATDQRDKIFALLALASNSFGIEPDYSKSLEDIQVEAARAAVLHGGDLELLSARILFADETRSATSLPSWVPKLDEAFERESSFVHLQIQFSAGLSNPSRLQLSQIERSSDPLTLKLSGIYLDMIKGTPEPKGIYQWTISDHIAVISELINGTPKGIIYFTGESLLEAYCQTLYAGEDNRFTKEMAKKFEILYSQDGIAQFPRSINMVDIEKDEVAVKFTRRSRISCTTSRYGVTPSNYLALLPSIVEVGDIICVLYGCKIPLLLRAVDGSNFYKVIGAVYVHGFMFGEAIAMQEKGLLQEREFNLK
ncbi:hypothetical protein EG329_011844 [Mollisiaceae sp. DMI_Dod_QoI]|nr:hypothetical protein EG329_011844 [Helotiales sp. DMI_Dod_QoI]